MTESHIRNTIKHLDKRKSEVSLSDKKTLKLFNDYITAFRIELRNRGLDKLV